MLAQQLKHFDVINTGAAGTFVVRAPTNQTRLRAEPSRRLPFETSIIICKGRDLLDVAKCKLFGDEPVGSDVSASSVSWRRVHAGAVDSHEFPGQGKWLLRIQATEKRFVRQYRRYMKTIGLLKN